MREAVPRIYRERRSLIAGLKVSLCLTFRELLTAVLQDIDSIVAKLDWVLLSVVVAAIIFICLLIFNRNNTITSLVPLATMILGFSFIFGSSAQNLFESVSHIKSFENDGLVPWPSLCTAHLYIFNPCLWYRRPCVDWRSGVLHVYYDEMLSLHNSNLGFVCQRIWFVLSHISPGWRSRGHCTKCSTRKDKTCS